MLQPAPVVCGGDAVSGEVRPWATPAHLQPPEKVFQEQVVQLARHCGWLVYHTYDARRSEKGFPDLVMVRGARVVVAELKSASGRVTPEQMRWIEAFKRIPHIQTFVWRPGDWDEVEATLVPSREELALGGAGGTE